MGWTVRKVAGMMDVFLDIEAKDEGLFTSLKTKLKNTDNLLLYSGVTKTKGLSDDEVNEEFYLTTPPHHTYYTTQPYPSRPWATPTTRLQLTGHRSIHAKVDGPKEWMTVLKPEGAVKIKVRSKLVRVPWTVHFELFLPPSSISCTVNIDPRLSTLGCTSQ